MNATAAAEFAEALSAAKRRAKEIGFAYAVEWPLGHCTCEDRKPMLRDSRCRVIEVDANGMEHFA